VPAPPAAKPAPQPASPKGATDPAKPASQPTAAKPAPAPVAEKKAIVYACPMHPEVTSDKPGKCSKCGMDLVPKK
jgi:hypothetical protein